MIADTNSSVNEVDSPHPLLNNSESFISVGQRLAPRYPGISDHLSAVVSAVPPGGRAGSHAMPVIDLLLPLRSDTQLHDAVRHRGT